jgi:hypothetical protein
LRWVASTDDDGVARYRVYRDGVLLGTVTTASYRDTAVNTGSTYRYHVVAQDLAGNLSGASTSVAGSPSSASGVLVFAPTGDTFVRSDTPSTNYGASTVLEVDNSPVQHILLRFSVAGVGTRRVLSAKVRLHVIDPSTHGGNFHSAPGSWSEGTVTWSNAPVASTFLGSIGSVAPNNWYEVDVTPAVTGDGEVSLRASSPVTDGADYASKEGNAGLAPQLVVAVG